ncbi:MAG TPA: TonB-dependent receptor [Spirochaetota bacterium]|nr:TonB-dependent receptor [Spirochaetota bacterium]
MLIKHIRYCSSSCVIIGLLVCSVLSQSFAYGQNRAGGLLRGTVYNSETKKPVASGSVAILELKKNVPITGGIYQMPVPKSDSYTVIVKSEGLNTLTIRISVEGATVKNFFLGPVAVQGKGITITGRRDLQTVSRHTMTLKQLKDVPATFGDSMNAIAALPGVIRSGGDLFGPIIIRGGDQHGIRYLVDDIPIYSPLHYGGLHSVINSNMINEIDLFASAFPAEFGSATSAVISIDTTDDVREFGGYGDLSLLSAAALVQTSIVKKLGGGGGLGPPLEDQKKEDRNAGYIIASGRIGYFDLIVLPLIGLLTGEKIGIVPKYWDYQFKLKYLFNNDHSLTLFAMGSKDYFKLLNDETVNDGRDPLLTGIRAQTDQQTHGQGLYYTYRPSEHVQNKLIFYASLKQNYLSLNMPAPGVNIAFKGVEIDSRPYIFGFMDKFKVTAVKKYFEIRGGIEYTLYDFVSKGKTLESTARGVTTDISENDFIPVLLDNTVINHVVGGYLEPKITYAGLTIIPGFRSEYLNRSGKVTWDPRLLISYEFPTETTISVAGGKYSYFFQTNSNFFDASPQYAKEGKRSNYEWAFHRVAGIEQTIKLFKLKVEGFWNEFFDLTERYVHIGRNGMLRYTMNSGGIRACGAEIMLKKDRRENEDGLFGWISYTFTKSMYRSGLPYYFVDDGTNVKQSGDLWGRYWHPYQFEQNHNVKVILGYAYGKHTFTGKFLLYTSSPYTPIVWFREDEQYHIDTGLYRFYPVYGRPNSRHFPVDHRLDFRYSHTTNYSWGYVTLYVEIINVYNNRPIIMESWDYRLPMYPGLSRVGPGNPRKASFSDSVAFIPNFGVEVKF